MINAYRTIIVPASPVDTYRTLAATWETGIGMFLTPLYKNSVEPTHYISSGALDLEVANLLNNPAAFVEKINYLTGASMTETEAQALRDEMEVVSLPESGEPGAESVEVTLARLGLSKTPPSE